MAKLPDVPMGGRVSPTQTISPGAAVADYRARQGIADTVFKIGAQVSNAYAEDQINNVNADHRQVVTDTLRFIEENETLSKKELKQMGIIDQVETTGLDGEELEYVPRHQWASVLLENESENSRLMYGDRIQSPKARSAWLDSAKKNDDMAVRASLIQTARYAQEYQYKQMTSRFETAVNSGDWDRAQEVLNSDTMTEIYQGNPELKNSMQTKITQGREKDTLYTQAMSSDPDELDKLVMDMTDPNYVEKSSLPIQDRRAILSAVVSRQNYLLQKEKLARDARSEGMAAMFESQINSDLENFDIQSVDKALNNGSLSYDDYRLVMGAYRRTMSGESYKVSPDVDAEFENIAFDLQNGYYPEDTDYFEQVSKLADWTRKQRQEGTVDADTMRGWNDRIGELRQAPYSNPEYKNQVSELSKLITGVDDSSPFARFTTDESSIDFQMAKNDLIQWMKRNGGASADISEWRSKHMASHLEGAARRQFYKLPENVTSAVVFKGSKVDSFATIQSLQAKIASQQQEIAATKGEQTKKILQEQLRKNRLALVEFERYVNGIGKAYVE